MGLRARKENSTKQEIVNLYQQGYGPDAIARKLIVSHGLVTTILCENNCIPTKEEQIVIDQKIIVTLYNAGLTQSQISWKLNLDENWVADIIETNSRALTVCTAPTNITTSAPVAPRKKSGLLTAIPKKSGYAPLPTRRFKNNPKKAEVLLAKRMFWDLVMGRSITDIAEQHCIFRNKALALLKLINIGIQELNQIRQIKRCRDIIIGRKLSSLGYSTSIVAAHLEIAEHTMNNYLVVPIHRLVYSDERNLAKGLDTMIFKFIKSARSNVIYQISKRKIAKFLTAPISRLSPANKQEQQIKTRKHVLHIVRSIKREINAGKTIKDIAFQINISQQNIHKYLAVAGTDVSTLKIERLKAKQANRFKTAQECIQLWERGYSLQEITAATSATIYRVKQVLDFAGIDPLVLSTAHKMRIRVAFEEGKTVMQICNSLSCERATVYKVIPKKEIDKKTKKDRTEKALAFKKLHNAGMGFAQIAKIYGITAPTVKNHLVRYCQHYLPRNKNSKADAIKKALLAGWSIQAIIQKGIASETSIYRCKKELKL